MTIIDDFTKYDMAPNHTPRPKGQKSSRRAKTFSEAHANQITNSSVRPSGINNVPIANGGALWMVGGVRGWLFGTADSCQWQ